MKTYGLERYYYNMPQGFSDTNVVEEDREVYNDMYRRLDAGAQLATAEFRVTSDLHWARVTMYQESPALRFTEVWCKTFRSGITT